MGIYDNLMKDFVSPFGEYNDEEQKIIDEWKKNLKIDVLDMTPFRDVDFLQNFLKTIPENEQFKYVENTNNYHCRSGYRNQVEFDSKFVIVTRRSVPSDNPKPEQYWTDEHKTALLGLKNEIPQKSAQRMHSVIMVSTLEKLKSHGEPKNDEMRGAASDGEIIINSEPFSLDNLLFMYKPKKELEELNLYIKNGGISKDEVLLELKKRMDSKNDFINDLKLNTIEVSANGQLANDYIKRSETDIKHKTNNDFIEDEDR